MSKKVRAEGGLAVDYKMVEKVVMCLDEGLDAEISIVAPAIVLVVGVKSIVNV